MIHLFPDDPLVPSRDFLQGPQSALADEVILALRRLRESRDGSLRLRADVPQGIGGALARKVILVFECFRKSRDRSLGLWTNVTQSLGSKPADRTILVFEGIATRRESRPFSTMSFPSGRNGREVVHVVAPLRVASFSPSLS